MSSAPSIPNVLAQRYASPEMRQLWSAENKVVLERRLWIALLRAQRSLGIAVPDQAIGAYESVVDKVDLVSIRARERVTRHDVKARIEEFCALAGYEEIHKGMTSRDLTENVEQMQVRDSMVLVRQRAVAALARLAELAAEYATTVLTGRSHNVPAQATTLGKRFANAGEELLHAFERIEQQIDRIRCAASRARSARSKISSIYSAVIWRRWRSSKRWWPSTSASSSCLRMSDKCIRARSTSRS